LSIKNFDPCFFDETSGVFGIYGSSFATKTYQEIILPAATLARYIGEYQLEPGLILTISKESDPPEGWIKLKFQNSTTKIFKKIS
jgi:hypothetical protein